MFKKKNRKNELDDSGVFTITESFEFGKNRSAFFPTVLPDGSSASSSPSGSTTASISSLSCSSSLRSVKKPRIRSLKRTETSPRKWPSDSSLSSWRAYLSDWRTNILTVRNVLRLVSYSFCFFYCIKYAHHIYSQFGNYETMVTLEFRSQRTTLAPAISLCSHCILCTLSEHRLRNTAIHKILIEPDTWHWVQREKKYVVHEDMHVECRISQMFKEGYINCAEVIKPVVSLQEGHKCLTFFSNMNGQISRLNSSMRELITLDFNYAPRITLLINGTFVEGRRTGSPHRNTTNLNMSDPKRATFRRTGVYIKLHERNLLTDMKDLNYKKVRPGVRTEIAFTKRTVRLLPKPYKTNCFNYSANQQNYTEPPWKIDKNIIFAAGKVEVDSGLTLYRTRGECILYCLWRMLSTSRCVNFFSIIDSEVHKAELLYRRTRWVKEDFDTHSGDPDLDAEDLKGFNHSNMSMFAVRYCLNSESQYLEYVNAKNLCVSHCLEDCYNEYFYEETVTEKENDRRSGSMRNKTQVDIDWYTGPVTNVYHNKKMDITEFFGTLGGHVHIWIGASVPLIIKFLVRMVKQFAVPAFKKHVMCC